jgi:hypothetical protein
VTLNQALRIRTLLGAAGALVVALFFAAVLDSCVARFRQPLFTVNLLPGQSEAVEGQVDHALKDLTLLRVETSSAEVQLAIDRFQSGQWLGGNMWIGAISAAPGAAAGVYALRVFGPGPPAEPPVAAFRAVVHPDDDALRRSSLSVIRRTFDIAPGTAALACLPALGAVLGLVYLMSRSVERRMAELGRAEVFRVRTSPGGLELYFGLGRSHGVEPGMRVAIRSESDRPICTAVVQAVDGHNALALAEPGVERLPPVAVAVLPAATVDEP